MTLNSLFKKRINWSADEKVSFETLDRVLLAAAMSIPFENLRILDGTREKLTKNSLSDKILVRNEGGLCYELNGLLYLFLIENGFDAALVRGIIYDQQHERWSGTGKTHAAVLIRHEGRTYIADTGFGVNLPLKAVPMDGEIVSSLNGEFRILRRETEYGYYILEMKLKHKHGDWKKGYAFNPDETTPNVENLNDMQTVIHEHPASPFNKSPLITRLTPSGALVLTDKSFSEREDGKTVKLDVEDAEFRRLAKEKFGLNTAGRLTKA
ncbi:arylamine N-acetyltransferase family protein [Peribacillus sp. SCS-26]|uniref:arylamine N-acetyltransferase family protein n=1 Tax=Paraperibacillus marinus TaxID=3115295 RepID=UPI0039062984